MELCYPYRCTLVWLTRWRFFNDPRMIPVQHVEAIPVVNKAEILIVDDEELIRWTLREALRGWSFAPVEAGSVSEALAMFDAEQPIAVLLDINLPVLDGFEVCRIREPKRGRCQSSS